MTNPTSLIDGLRNNADAAGSAEANPMPAPAREVGPATTRISDQANGGGATILRHPAAPEPTPPAQYLDTAFDLDNARIPFVRFRGIRHVLPDHEGYVVGWRSLVREIAPDPAPVIGNKDAVPYFIAGTLKDAELINEKLRQARARIW